MFKFLHAADLHLDSPLLGLARYETAPADAIRGATRRAFENMVDLALDEEVAFVLLAGDLFDGDWKDHQTGIYFNQQMARLERGGVRVLVVAGNHDAASKITKALRPPTNVTSLSTRKPESVRLDELEVVVHGQGFKDQHTLDNLAAEYPQAVPGRFNIGLLHTSLNGREGHEPYAPCSLNDLRQKGYQYWALGHVHQREVVCTEPLVVFPGCTQGRHVRETGPKGCTLVTVDNGEIIEHEHRDLDVVRWLDLSVDAEDADGMDELVERVRSAMKAAQEEAGDRLLAVRVGIDGATHLDGQLRSDPDRWRSQVQAVGAELGAEQVWVEKVKLRTQVKLALADALRREDALGRLLSFVAEHDSRADAVPGLSEVVIELKAKLPPGFSVGEVAYDPSSPEFLAEVIEEAKASLLSRLLKTGAES